MSTVSAAPQGRAAPAHALDHDRTGEIVEELPADPLGRAGPVEQLHDQAQRPAGLVGGAGVGAGPAMRGSARSAPSLAPATNGAASSASPFAGIGASGAPAHPAPECLLHVDPARHAVTPFACPGQGYRATRAPAG